MLCLGIESTAHTFSCAIVERGRRSRILHDERRVYAPPEGQGIHPREASRHHAAEAAACLAACLEGAGARASEVDAMAYAAGPGLGPCLRVGAVVARALASYHGVPLYPVHHAIGHIELGKMLTKTRDPLVLLVSGGHTMLLAFSAGRWRVFGETLDITLGQLFDQFGRSLGLASPCGRQVEAMAARGGEYIALPYTVKGNDVSLSGLCSAAMQAVASGASRESASHSLQETAFAMVCEATERALALTRRRELLVVGGVAANSRLSSMLRRMSRRHSCRLAAAPVKYAGDCGAQIAWAGALEASVSGPVKPEEATVRQSWRLDEVDIAY
ncbi:MAG: KEOPS complex N(6)-L-threonylcarbamoyladenine synthase Kae1 [Thaumarchaeota archaeon]|nr:KEOPS complex N(6)-L-threonylcarbamoyladenine synthase Kae1 [Nitrososphaerota archaeon]MDD9812652.1 KEOPS complex N(6)-L-threonylcarbamoyladenine synthase Kae1 [Nitrososphaerota archaeon]MDD9826225.1 KEOPS complex N(6)-L-threonylcarbamoyladenine synthase Kae1 [Nitrososphaerota archaeon]MDD9843618.1 KEOPS complex N(6)-L-threonylcarbamoyladenine synthase Kae1 [Nitrososphaerota archaeon]RNJ72464.1 MAG: tRNA (adenosine(37)-N6)-threonylcarbamoyltransferase complex transferase subunit TsaD [Thauma